MIRKPVILITGAGGSIGSELCRQILSCSPRRVVLLDLCEFALYSIDREIRPLAEQSGVEVTSVLGSICDRPRIRSVMEAHQVQIVLHAAAYKHVPLMENDNVCEALRNNVIGTYALAMACKQHGVSKFVLISTDKAVNPTNVMGASKRLAEMVCQGLQDEIGTRFVIVRFGNVLGSSGSVIPSGSSVVS